MIYSAGQNLNEYLQKEYGDFFQNDTKNVKVSIIIPCYNVEKFISDCLGSVVKQTFKDFEAICINDGSKDSTLEIINEFAKLDSRIVVIDKENGGQSSARNKGLEIAKGEYISFLDSDDWLDDNFIESLYNAAKEKDCDIACSTIIRKRETSWKYRVHYTEKAVFSDLKDKINISGIPKCCYVWNKLYKSELVKNTPFQTNAFYEDVLWIPNIIKNADKIVTVPNTNYYYRVNKNSTVKAIQTPKKQIDLYRAKKRIIKFFDENKLDLPKKDRNVTKEIKYLFGVPVLKVKEYKNTDTTLLFGFLPIFKKRIPEKLKYQNIKEFFYFKNLDAHFYIELFRFLRISIKNNKKFDYSEVTEYGLEKNPRETKLIVSLASFPARINIVHKTINTLLNQTVKPDKLILWLADSQFPNKESELPPELLKLRDFGLEIRWCEDLRSYKKLVPALKEFPNDIIVTADDDLYYRKDWLESLYSSYLKNPEYIYTRRACGLTLRDNVFSVSSHYSNKNYKPTYLNQLMGGAGTLYPPHSLHEDIFNTDLIKTLIPTHDDIYFWIMAVLKGTKICLIKNEDSSIYNIEGSQVTALCRQTKDKNAGMLPRDAFSKILAYYPKAYDLLEEESRCQE